MRGVQVDIFEDDESTCVSVSLFSKVGTIWVSPWRLDTKSALSGGGCVRMGRTGK